MEILTGNVRFDDTIQQKPELIPKVSAIFNGKFTSEFGYEDRQPNNSIYISIFV